METIMTECNVCFRHCKLKEGQTGFCKGRICQNKEVVCANYGRITSLALDPLEKKPFAMFFPGKKILSVGSYGCNLSCKFCQNHRISYAGEINPQAVPYKLMSPYELCTQAVALKQDGNIGLAFTYNEPLIGWEYIKDCSVLSHDRGLKNVLVTNGTAQKWVLEEIIPYIDAMNIDIKGFNESFYKNVAGGSLKQTKEFIESAFGRCHIELTTLIIPGYNDSEDEMRSLSEWIKSLDENIPYHVSRFFPRHRMSNLSPTPVDKIYHLADVARENLNHVFTGNC